MEYNTLKMSRFTRSNYQEIAGALKGGNIIPFSFYFALFLSLFLSRLVSARLATGFKGHSTHSPRC